MAKQRYINTKFWRDSYIEELDPSEKLLFLYLLTNPDTNISGIYEIPLKIIAVDTGIDKDMVKKLLDRFETDNKIKYKNGWIAIKNFTNHQTISPKIKTGIENEIKKAPEHMREWVNLNEDIGYTWGMNEVSDSNTNSNNNPNDNSNKIESRMDKELEIHFKEFWDTYDKKTNMSKCKKKYLKLSESDRDKIRSTLKDYIASTPDKQYRKNPETYLNNHSWNDEIINRSNNQHPKIQPIDTYKIEYSQNKL